LRIKDQETCITLHEHDDDEDDDDYKDETKFPYKKYKNLILPCILYI
jgi:hypothetical protein